MKYTIKKELKKPFIRKPYVEYHLVYHWTETYTAFPGAGWEDREFQRVIFKSKDESEVNKFMEALK